MRAALDYLEREQMADGSWFGRWGVNYVYGTWSVLCALNAAGFDADGAQRAPRRRTGWSPSRMRTAAGARIAQLQARLSRLRTGAVHRVADRLGAAGADGGGTRWIIPPWRAASPICSATQDATGLWRQDAYTGGGFPRVFYLRYHGYPKFFPLWALARYRNLRRSNVRRVVHGM